MNFKEGHPKEAVPTFGAGFSDKICPHKSKLVDQIMDEIREKEFVEASKAAIEKALTKLPSVGKHSAHDQPRSKQAKPRVRHAQVE